MIAQMLVVQLIEHRSHVRPLCFFTANREQQRSTFLVLINVNSSLNSKYGIPCRQRGGFPVGKKDPHTDVKIHLERKLCNTATATT